MILLFHQYLFRSLSSFLSPQIITPYCRNILISLPIHTLIPQTFHAFFFLTNHLLTKRKGMFQGQSKLEMRKPKIDLMSPSTLLYITFSNVPLCGYNNNEMPETAKSDATAIGCT